MPSIEIYNNCYKFDVNDVIQLEICRVTCTRSPQRPLASGLYLVPYGYRILCMRSSGDWAYVYLLDQRGLDLIRRAQFAHQLYRYDPGVNAHTYMHHQQHIHPYTASGAVSTGERRHDQRSTRYHLLSPSYLPIITPSHPPLLTSSHSSTSSLTAQEPQSQYAHCTS